MSPNKFETKQSPFAKINLECLKNQKHYPSPSQLLTLLITHT